MYKLQRKFIYGWDDTEFGDDEKVVTYATKKKAQDSLDEHIEDVNTSHAMGLMDEGYENDMKVVEIIKQ